MNEEKQIKLEEIPVFRINEKLLGDYRSRLVGIEPKILAGEPERMQLLFDYDIYLKNGEVIQKVQPMMYSTKPGTRYYDFMAELLKSIGFEEIALEELIGVDGVVSIREEESNGKMYENVVRFIPDTEEVQEACIEKVE